MNRSGIYWLLAFVIWFLIMMFFSWYTSSGTRDVQIEEASFEVLSSDEIYFRNLRINKYIVELDSASGFDILRHKKTEDDAPLNFKLIRNWRQRMAYIFPDVEPNTYHWIKIADAEPRSLRDQNAEYHLKTATAVFNAIRNELPIEVGNDRTNTTIESKDLGVQKEVITDYLRLTHHLP